MEATTGMGTVNPFYNHIIVPCVRVVTQHYTCCGLIEKENETMMASLSTIPTALWHTLGNQSMIEFPGTTKFITTPCNICEQVQGYDRGQDMVLRVTAWMEKVDNLCEYNDVENRWGSNHMDPNKDAPRKPIAIVAPPPRANIAGGVAKRNTAVIGGT